MTIKIFPNFITPEEAQEMNEWVNEGVKNGWLDVGLSGLQPKWDYALRYTTRNYGNRFDKYPDVVYNVYDRITKLLGLESTPKSVIGGGKDGIVVSCTFPSGCVHEHKDPKEGNLEVLRCNILTQAADFGGELFLNDERIDISVGDLHCYLPSKYPHYVTQVNGSTNRILWMFGYAISDTEWESKEF